MKTLILWAAILSLVFSPVAWARPISGATTSIKMGSFTGPVDGAAQDDNVKASLDLAHTDLDAGLAYNVDVLGLLGLGGVATVWYVDSAEATGTEDGTSWATATDTLDEAISLAGVVADDADIILVAAGHSETLTAADGVDCDVAGITIIGLGNGENRPLFDYTNANGEFVIGTDDVAIHNLQFLANVTDVTTAINVETGSENFVIDNCRFYVDSTGTDEFTDAITTTADCDNGRITNCRFEMGAGGADAAIQNVGCDYLEISGNIITGDYATACIEDKTTASIWVTIKDNVLVNGTVGGAAGLNAVACISLKADTAAMIVNNSVACNVATPDLSIVAADGFLFNNIYNETEGGDSGGQLVGTRAGQTYTATKTATSDDDDLFDVDGGPILITSFTGVVTTQIGAVANALSITLDADSGWIDSDFSTAVELNGDVAGTRYVFSDADESVLTPISDTNGNTNSMRQWYCGEGMIEQVNGGAGTTGAIKWYMTYIPFDDGTTVTPQ